jgi:prepilin-type N-terminal cleavage/methylation domain-containing protein
MRRRGGFTLIELLVATAIGVLLVGVVAFVFTQSRKAYSETTNRIGVMLQVRQSLEKMKRDVLPMLCTSNMEFYDDLDWSGHYSGDAEELDGQNGAAGFDAANSAEYDFAPALHKAEYRRDLPPDGDYRSDSLYFKTEAWGEKASPVLVEYRLEDAGPDKVLVRRVAHMRGATDTRADARFGTPTTRVLNCEPEVLLENVLSFQVEVQGRPDLPFYDAQSAPGGLGLAPLSAAPGEFRVGLVYRSDNHAGIVSSGGAFRDPGCTFDLLRLGSRVYIYDPQPAALAPGEYTVADIERGANVTVTLQEKLPLASEVQVSYRAAVLPTAFRVTFKVRLPGTPETITCSSVLAVR